MDFPGVPDITDFTHITDSTHCADFTDIVDITDICVQDKLAAEPVISQQSSFKFKNIVGSESGFIL